MQTKKHKFQDGREDNQFEQLVSKYIPYWPAFLLSIVLGISVSYIYLRYTTPIYEANATLIIKDERKGNEESKLVESLDQISSKKIVENEIEILQSRKVMLDVIKSLGLYAQIYEQGDILNTLLYNRYPISILAENPDTLKSSDKINNS
jgi:tyrosine-protein kinase Etk/Wzc